MTNADQNSLETVFWLQSVACSMSDGNKKTMILTIFGL